MRIKTICNYCQKQTAIDNVTCSKCRAIIKRKEQYKSPYTTVKPDVYNSRVKEEKL